MFKIFGMLCIITSLAISPVLAKEGMWVPALLKKYNIEEMQKMGFKLTADDIYDINNTSMKDAVVIFGGGCTGELISPDGLLITNHHCGYRQIQQHSSLENDYLANGFWAKNRGEELPNPGLSVSFLERMEDVTKLVLLGTENLTDPVAADKKISENTSEIEKKAAENGKFRAQVRPFFYGNQYFLHVYKVYTDVRLVGAPPSSIGKFGGDTDNWMWPRHTGDFSVFRVYANSNNEPAAYSKNNIPFKSKKFFSVSIKGVKPGDFTLVFGYPGRTTRFLTSDAVDLILNQRNPDRISIRESKLGIMKNFMDNDPKVRIQYSAKAAGVSNSWKRWQGEIVGLKRMNALELKRKFENNFELWAINNGKWENNYAQVFRNFTQQYKDYAGLAKASDYYTEIVFQGVELFTAASYINIYLRQISREGEISPAAKATILRLLESFFKDYHQPLDEQFFVTLMPELTKKLNSGFLPADVVAQISKLDQKNELVKMYQQSMLTDSSKLKKLIEFADIKGLKILEKDPVMKMFLSLRNFYDKKVSPPLLAIETAIDTGMKQYVAGIMQMEAGKPIYPDANSTLRVTYGKVEGFNPADGIEYKYYTTLGGKIQKDNPNIFDYDVPEKLKELYTSKDYGQYAVNGEMPVCFIASNHTSGGNSGSPVLDGEGNLIGLNFDRSWEGTMSDIMFDPDMCRNISLDIRYALFIIDKFAGAGYLLNEMKIVY